MNEFLSIDKKNYSVSVDAGGDNRDSFFRNLVNIIFRYRFSFASQGSSHIGGNLATNVGGVRALRYGNIRQWVLNLKAVLGTGEILSAGKALRKNQCGYSLKDLLIGSEGTLGIITQATLSCIPRGINNNFSTVVLCKHSSIEDAMQTFISIRDIEVLSMFEIMCSKSVDSVLAHKGSSFKIDSNFF